MSRVLVVCDLDGTVTFTPQRPDEAVMAALQALSERDGVRLAIATARSPRCVRRWFPELVERLDLVCCNGALTLGARSMARRCLPRRSLAIAVRRLERAGVGYCLEYGTHFVASDLGGLPWMGQEHRVVLPSGARGCFRGVLKCSVADAAAAARAAAWLPGIVAVPHASGDADLMAAGVSKDTAVERLRARDERVVAFGNDRNDLSMLLRADTAYVVGQGLRELDAYRHVRRLESDPARVADALEEVVRSLAVEPRPPDVVGPQPVAAPGRGEG